MKQDDLKGLRVSGNRYDLSKSTDDEDGVDFDIVEIAVHEEFDVKTMQNDIALLQIKPQDEFKNKLGKLSTVAIDATDAGLKALSKQVRELRQRRRKKRTERESMDDRVHLSPVFHVSGAISANATRAKRSGRSMASFSLLYKSTSKIKTRTVKGEDEEIDENQGSKEDNDKSKDQNSDEKKPSDTTKELDEDSVDGIKETGLNVEKNAEALKKANEEAERIQGVQSNSTINVSLFATGWGVTKENDSTPSANLQRIRMKTMQKDRCMKSKSFDGGLDPAAVVCALAANFRSDTCQGDSGGPLYTEDGDNQWTLVGIVSYGIGCARQRKENDFTLQEPGIYTRTFHYSRMIAAYLDRVEKTLNEAKADE